MAMKLSWQTYDLQLKHTFKIANFSRNTTPLVFVQLEYDGLVGYGEASMPPYLGETQASVIAFLQRLDLSQFTDPTKIEDILEYVDSLAINNTAAKASVDIALHDLVGKMIGAPWYKIWGLDTQKIPATTVTIGIASDAEIKQKITEIDKEVKIIKVKLGSDDDKAIIKSVRSGTNLPLAVDANQGWKNKHQALEMIYWLKEQGTVMIEQPMGKYDLDNIAWLTERSPLPIYADESCQRLHDVEKLKGVFSGINIKLMKCTGMREGWKMRNLAEALGMDVMVGCMTETSCAISAAAQLTPGVNFVDLDGPMLIKNNSFTGASLNAQGQMMPNEKPGIGVEKIS